MGYLKDKSVYLCGAINVTLEKDYGVGWRDSISSALESFGVIVLNPCKDGAGDSEQDQIHFKALIKDRKFDQLKKEFYRVIRKDLKAVDKSDFLIFYHNPIIPTIGSIHEVINANIQKKPILVLCDEEYIDRLNPWLLTLIKPQWLFTNRMDMFKYLTSIDSGNIDTSHWW